MRHALHLGHLVCSGSLSIGSATLVLHHHLLGHYLLLKHGNLLVLPHHKRVLHHLLLFRGHLSHLLLLLDLAGHTRHLHTRHLHAHREAHLSHVSHIGHLEGGLGLLGLLNRRGLSLSRS